MTVLTREQRIALKEVYDRPTDHITTLTYREFRRTAVMHSWDTCVMVPWQGIFLGIEEDGYTHS